MSRRLVLTFEVKEGATISDQGLLDLADEIVKWIDPDPPVLIWEGAEVQRRK